MPMARCHILCHSSFQRASSSMLALGPGCICGVRSGSQYWKGSFSNSIRVRR
jgi:hypothetical protein